MEQQAKERLTGGFILVVALVLLVPELLTGPRSAPPPAPAQPDQAPMRSYTMELGEATHARAPVAASTTAAPAHEAVAAASAPQPAVSAPPRTASEPGALPAPPPAPLHAAPHAPPAHLAEHAAEHTGAWTVQVGTFSSRDNAAHLIAGLKSHGFSATVSEATKNGHKLFRVRVGNERDRAAAQKLLARLKAAGQKSPEIVPR
ncbi:MAG TPA: SPOR domain-containing protein [Steroidobacteraceae bacterium]|nr:SPOR domain-containing protein [Steroidobacteraceae bacterium]